MCGIFGVISEQYPIQIHDLVRASFSLKHRGPDEYGFLLGGSNKNQVFYDTQVLPKGDYQIGLGHQRLSIIDLDSGRQPLSNEDGTIWCVFNGEIYNYRRLRQFLTGKGHVFKTHSDTEVLCHGYEEWGTQIVDQIEGIFAFCIYDSRKKEVILFRDPIGVKPLYYHVKEGLFCFASEIKAILAYVPDIKISDENIFEFFLFDQIPPPKTPFKDIYRLDAGEFCVVDSDSGSIKEKNKYWDYHFHIQPRPEKAMIAEVEETLKRVVEKQLVSDVPVGVFLSGGIDSTLITKILMEKGNLTAFHLYSEDGFSEYGWVRKIRNLSEQNLVKVLFHPTLQDCVDALKNVDDLLYDPSILPTYIISKAAAQKGFKVILSGDGGDENFAGYDTPFYSAFLFSKYQKMGINQWGRSPVFRMLQPRYFQMVEKYIHQRSILPQYADVQMNNLLSAKKYAPESLMDFRKDLLDHFVCEGARNPELNGLLYVWYKAMLEAVILKKVDLASMANSVEVRVPFLDKEMVHLALSIPFEFKIRRKGKYPLKVIAERHFGRCFAYRRKRGFTFDFSKIFLKPGMEDYLKSNLYFPGVDQFLDIPKIMKLMEKNKKDVVQGKKLWRVLMFTEWYKNWGGKHV